MHASKHTNKTHTNARATQVPFITVVTDLGGAHKTWFHKDVDLCCVPGDVVEDLALKNGVAREKVCVCACFGSFSVLWISL